MKSFLFRRVRSIGSGQLKVALSSSLLWIGFSSGCTNNEPIRQKTFEEKLEECGHSIERKVEEFFHNKFSSEAEATEALKAVEDKVWKSFHLMINEVIKNTALTKQKLNTVLAKVIEIIDQFWEICEPMITALNLTQKFDKLINKIDEQIRQGEKWVTAALVEESIINIDSTIQTIDLKEVIAIGNDIANLLNLLLTLDILDDGENYIRAYIQAWESIRKDDDKIKELLKELLLQTQSTKNLTDLKSYVTKVKTGYSYFCSQRFIDSIKDNIKRAIDEQQ